MIDTTAPTRRPTHPGAILREEILPAAGCNQTDLAAALKVSRRAVSEIVLEQRPVTTDMACRLARAFGNSPEFWLNMQQAVDVWEAKTTKGEEYERIDKIAVNAA